MKRSGESCESLLIHKCRLVASCIEFLVIFDNSQSLKRFKRKTPLSLVCYIWIFHVTSKIFYIASDCIANTPYLTDWIVILISRLIMSFTLPGHLFVLWYVFSFTLISTITNYKFTKNIQFYNSIRLWRHLFLDPIIYFTYRICVDLSSGWTIS